MNKVKMFSGIHEYNKPFQPAYTEEADACEDSDGCALALVGCWKALVKQNPHEPLFTEMAHIHISGYLIDSGLKIMIPNASALQKEANRYKEKYGIEIYVVESENLIGFIEHLNASKDPRYVGVIAGKEMGEEASSHVTPLLFYFPGHQMQGEREALVLDSVGLDDFSKILRTGGLREEKIWKTTKPRQVDTFSCRTGALTLLRNALLSLNYHKQVGGFEAILKEGEVKGEEITYLPPEWDYTEQVTNKYLNERHFAIRSFYSSKEEKRGEGALAHRERKKEEVNFRATFWSSTCSHEFKSQPPLGFNFSFFEKELHFSFEISKKVNTYLVNKGIRNSQK